MSMKQITQLKIAEILNRSQSFVSKRLSNNSLRGFEILKLSNELKVPIKAFVDENAQIKYLGKSYIREHNTKQSNTIATPQGQNNGTR